MTTQETQDTQKEFEAHMNRQNGKFIKFLCEWQKEHVEEYAGYRRRFEAMADGDYSAFTELFGMATSCIPFAVTNECLRLFGKEPVLVTDDESDVFDLNEKEMEELLAFDGYLKAWIEDGELETDLVVDKEDPEPEDTWYVRIKGTREWWNSLPMQYRMIGQMMTGKSSDELRIGARRVLIAAYVNLETTFERMYALAYEKKDPLMMSGLYYVMFEHGFRKTAKHLEGMMSLSNVTDFLPMLISNSIGGMASVSISRGYDRKSDWKGDFRDCENRDLRREVMQTIEDTVGRKGRPHIEQVTSSMDDCLAGKDMEALKKELLAVLDEMEHDYELAFVMEALHRSHHLADVSFPEFHHAVCAFAGREYTYDRAQRMYCIIAYSKGMFEESRSSRILRGRRLVRIWTERLSCME